VILLSELSKFNIQIESELLRDLELERAEFLSNYSAQYRIKNAHLIEPKKDKKTARTRNKKKQGNGANIEEEYNFPKGFLDPKNFNIGQTMMNNFFPAMNMSMNPNINNFGQQMTTVPP
jgi:hypothetical protein